MGLAAACVLKPQYNRHTRGVGQPYIGADQGVISAPVKAAIWKRHQCFRAGITMNFKTILLSTAACALLCGPAFAQDAAGTPPPKHHHRADPSVGARLDHLERVIE